MGSQDSKQGQQHPNDERGQHGDQSDSGRSGEGAASAMRQMIRQGDRMKRHQGGEAEDAGGHAQ